MSQIMKSFLGIFILLFMTACCVGIFGAFLNVMQAQNTYAAVVDELEESNFYPEVIRACLEKTESFDYALKITLLRPGADELVVESIADVPEDTSQVHRALVQMSFPVNIPLFDVGQDHILEGYVF